MNHAVTRGRWKIIGNASLEAALKIPPPRFIQDALDPDLFRIYEKWEIRPASEEGCAELKREAVWDPTHVNDRLRDHDLEDQITAGKGLISVRNLLEQSQKRCGEAPLSIALHLILPLA